jgi:hypothetical protein
VQAATAAVTAHGPFRPAYRDAEQQERDEIRDQECAAAVLGRISGKTQEVAETYRGPGNCEYYAETGAPTLILPFHCDVAQGCTSANDERPDTIQ